MKKLKMRLRCENGQKCSFALRWRIRQAVLAVLAVALVVCTLLQAAPLQGVFMALGGILTGTVALLLRNAATKFAGKCS